MSRPVVCVGGGPAGLYTAITARLAGLRDEVVVLERNPPGVTHGWGVVFWDDLLDLMHRTDPVSARTMRAAAEVWDGQVLRVNRRAPVFLGGFRTVRTARPARRSGRRRRARAPGR